MLNHFKNMLARRSLPSRKTWTSADWIYRTSALSLALCLTANAFGMRRAVTAAPKMLHRNYAVMSNEQINRLKALVHSPEFPQALAQTPADSEDLSELLSSIKKMKNGLESEATREFGEGRSVALSLLKYSALGLTGGPALMTAGYGLYSLLALCNKDLGFILAGPAVIIGFGSMAGGSTGLTIGGIILPYCAIGHARSKGNDLRNPKFKIAQDNMRHIDALIINAREMEELQIKPTKD